VRFEPKIIAFLCNWCSYAGADLVGILRTTCVPNVIPIRVMCIGGVEPAFILKAFQEGADGVLVCGCNPGECHYLRGNNNALQRIILLQRLLQQMGIEKDRLRVHWICASCVEDFVKVVNEITAYVKVLGPLNPQNILIDLDK
jgi:F420-non-reducing hydrogenase iron-sulfur subunit